MPFLLVTVAKEKGTSFFFFSGLWASSYNLAQHRSQTCFRTRGEKASFLQPLPSDTQTVTQRLRRDARVSP